jgi:hypothetical protein
MKRNYRHDIFQYFEDPNIETFRDKWIRNTQSTQSIFDTIPDETLLHLLFYASDSSCKTWGKIILVCKRWKTVIPLEDAFYNAHLYMDFNNKYGIVRGLKLWKLEDKQRLQWNGNDIIEPFQKKYMKIRDLCLDVKILGLKISKEEDGETVTLEGEEALKEDYWDDIYGYDFGINIKLLVESLGVRMPYFMHTITGCNNDKTSLRYMECESCIQSYLNDFDDIFKLHLRDIDCVTHTFVDKNNYRCFFASWEDHTNGFLMWISMLRMQHFFMNRGIKCIVETADFPEEEGSNHRSITKLGDFYIKHSHQHWVIIRIPECKMPIETLLFLEKFHALSRDHPESYMKGRDWLFGLTATLSPMYWPEMLIDYLLNEMISYRYSYSLDCIKMFLDCDTEQYHEKFFTVIESMISEDILSERIYYKKENFTDSDEVFWKREARDRKKRIEYDLLQFPQLAKLIKKEKDESPYERFVSQDLVGYAKGCAAGKRFHNEADIVHWFGKYIVQRINKSFAYNTKKKNYLWCKKDDEPPVEISKSHFHNLLENCDFIVTITKNERKENGDRITIEEPFTVQTKKWWLVSNNKNII